METINTFEEIKSFVVRQVETLVNDEEVYIVCDIYARFSIYLVEADENLVADIQKALESYVSRVVVIKKGEYIYIHCYFLIHMNASSIFFCKRKKNAFA